MAAAKPQVSCSQGIFEKFMPKTAPMTEGGSRNTVTTEKILRMLFWSMLIRPSVASRMNDTLVPRKEAWSLMASTSRDRVRKRARTSSAMGTVVLCCTKVSRRPRLTRLSRALEMSSPF